MTPSATELENTRVARFSHLHARTDIFNVQAVMPKGGLVVRKVIGAGIVNDATKPPAIGIEHPFSMTFVEIPPGQEAPLHAHTTEEVFFIVEGVVTFSWGDQGEHQLDVGQYDTVTMPKHVMRAFTNRGDRPARMMVTVSGTNEQTRDSVTYAPEIVARAAAAGVTL